MTRKTPTRRQAQQALATVESSAHSITARLLKLPMPGPGITISVALPLLPPYLNFYDLVPMTLAEVSEFEQLHQVRKPAGVVWVKRVKKDGPHGQ
jgi:hypothetical protein